ncbi:MAG: DUF3352 domain-containing protein [Calothrix sp. MO_167.B42]|nr:DUF3352 domain-containing protein [Calothrix sp. MO_167.B42]
MKQRSVFGLIAIGAVALVLIGCAIFYWLLPRSTTNLATNGTMSEPNAAIFIPKQAPVMVSMLINPERLPASSGKGVVSLLQNSVFTNSGINYQKDIQPWLGEEITLAVTTPDIDRDDENGLQPGYLMALATAQPAKSQEFVDLLFSQRVLAGNQLVVEEYEGVKLFYDHPEPTQSQNQLKQVENLPPLASALVGDSFVLFANDPQVLRNAVNNVQAPDVNLLSSDKYQKAIQELPKEPVLATAFINFPTVAQWQGLQLVDPVFDSQMVALKFSNKGLLAQNIILAASDKLLISTPLTTPTAALQWIPDTAGLVLTGKDLSNLGNTAAAQFWMQLTNTISGSRGGKTSQWVESLAYMQNSPKIDLSGDILSWIKGEYALGLLPNKGKKAPDWILVVDKADGQAGISRLDGIAAASGLSINSFSLDQQKISAWTQIQAATNSQNTQKDKSFNVDAQIRGLHTTLGDYEIFASSIAAMDKILATQGNNFTQNPYFQNGLQIMSDSNQGYAYFDWSTGEAMLKQKLPIIQLFSALGKPFVSKLLPSGNFARVSLIFSSEGSNTEFLKASLFLQLES